jgi:hypothetical protein
MSITERPGRLRSIGAVIAGLAAIFAVTTATDMVLHATGIFPPFGQPMSDGLFVLALLYRIVYGIGGSYLTARLAPDRPMGHALALGLVGLALSIAGTMATWGKGPEFGPKWYALAVAATAIPCAWAGGKIREARAARPVITS